MDKMEENEKTRRPINSASLIDLKAELFRKQEEFKKQKLQSQNTGFIKGKASTVLKKGDIWSKKNAGVLERAQRDLEAKAEEEDVYEKSKKSLENKAKLYEKITSSAGIPEEDGSEFFLVDFQKKAIDNIVEEREKEREKEEEDRRRAEVAEEKRLLQEAVPPPASADEEWVDYIDSLGRSRRCMKKDLPELKNKERQKPESNISQDKLNLKEGLTLMSDDMRREMLREKWEQEEREAMEGPLHYANVQFDEIRTHGVGFYQFDKKDATRQEQMEQLKDLRKQTVDERSKRERIKEKRKAVLEARLAKVKQRKKLKGGVVDTEEQEEEEEEIGPKLGEKVEETKKEPEQLTRDDSLRKSAPTREWDKGKERLFARSEERYFEERRSERVEEFAPPQMYYKDEGRNREIPAKEKTESYSYKIPKPKPLFQRKSNESSHQVPDKNIQETLQVMDIPLPASSSISEDLHKSVQDQDANLQREKGESFNILPPPPPSGFVQNVSQVPLPQNIDFSVPPPNFSVPPPNFSIPPPNMRTENLGNLPSGGTISASNFTQFTGKMDIMDSNIGKISTNSATTEGVMPGTVGNTKSEKQSTVSSSGTGDTNTPLPTPTEDYGSGQFYAPVYRSQIPTHDMVNVHYTSQSKKKTPVTIPKLPFVDTRLVQNKDA